MFQLLNKEFIFLSSLTSCYDATVIGARYQEDF